MRVGMVIDSFLPIIGGAELHVLEVSRALRKLGHDVKIVTSTPGEAEVDGFGVSRLPGFEESSLRQLLRSPSSLSRLVSAIRSVDIVHCHYTCLLSSTALAVARALRKPRLVTLHGRGTLDSSVGDALTLRSFRALSFRMTDGVIATSEEMKEVASRYVSEETIRMISNGVDTTFFTPRAREETAGASKPVILAMRRLAPKNGVQYLVECAPMVLERVPDAEFWIAGVEKLESHLRERVRALGITDRVRFLGEVPHDETRAFFSQAMVVAFPSSAESTSLACLEAMSMEKPVVASRLSAFCEMLGNDERGVLVRLFDREDSDYNAPMTLPRERLAALASAIVELCLDEQRRRELGRRARDFVRQNYDWGLVARRTSDFYDSLIGETWPSPEGAVQDSN